MHSNDNHDAYDYAERIRERLPRRLQELLGEGVMERFQTKLR